MFRHLRLLPIALAAAPFALGAQQAQPQTPPPRCASDSAYAVLDFWVGEWDVFVGEQKVGSNRIEHILDGCALLEHWRDAQGSEGKSLFYYLPARKEWKQVWIGDRALAPGGTKEKRLVAKLPDGGLRFLGELGPTPTGAFVLDRTTLTPMPDGRVRQQIQLSRDGGATWGAGFDAIYVRASKR